MTITVTSRQVRAIAVAGNAQVIVEGVAPGTVEWFPTGEDMNNHSNPMSESTVSPADALIGYELRAAAAGFDRQLDTAWRLSALTDLADWVASRCARLDDPVLHEQCETLLALADLADRHLYTLEHVFQTLVELTSLDDGQAVALLEAYRATAGQAA